MLLDISFDAIERAISCRRKNGVLVFDYKNVRSNVRLSGILLARLGIAQFLPRKLFSRNFGNTRYDFNDLYFENFMSRRKVKRIVQHIKPPRLLEFSNRSQYSSGWKVLLWRALDRVDRLGGPQAWIQLEYIKE